MSDKEKIIKFIIKGEKLINKKKEAIKEHKKELKMLEDYQTRLKNALISEDINPNLFEEN